ncbi:MAG: NusA-like transcription termination signal-binding factor [Candidatus Woesearchaeota archaeon]
MSRKYDQQTMQLISMFEQMTGSKLRDCFAIEDLQVFVVEKGQIGRAVGRNGANVKKLATALKSKIKIIEHSNDITQFIANTVHPIKPKRVEFDDELKIALITPPDLLSRGLLIGRQAIKLRETEKIIQRFFDVVELKVGRPEEGPQTVEEAQALERTVPPTVADVAAHPSGTLEESEEPANESVDEDTTATPKDAPLGEGPAQADDEAINTQEPSLEEELPEGAEVEGAGVTTAETQASKKERKTE